MWQRFAIDQIGRFKKQFPCICILGARQVGKTTLAKSFFKSYKYYDLESPQLQQRVLLDPEGFLESVQSGVVLDEAQFVPILFQALKVIIDASPRLKGKFIILGSANPLLLSQVSETLAGRIGFIELDPLISSEFAAGTPKVSLNNGWLRGGYPPALKQKSLEKRSTWLNAYIRTFIERDLNNLNIDIRIPLMRKILNMLAHVHGNVWNASSLAASAGVNYATINRYLDILEKGYLIRILPPFFINIKKRLIKSPKIYIRDSGLLNYLLGLYNLDSLLNSPYCGASWEGFVLEEIIRATKLLPIPMEYFFFRTQIGLECDLIIKSPEITLPIEVKFGSNLQENWFSNLARIMKDLDASNAILIYSGKESFIYKKTIRVLSVRQADYLGQIIQMLNPNSA